MESLPQSIRDFVKVPGALDKVYKDECMFCFCNGNDDGGLFVNLRSFQAFCRVHAQLDHQCGSDATLYLVIKRYRNQDDQNVSEIDIERAEDAEISEKLVYDFSRSRLKDKMEESYELALAIPGSELKVMPFDESSAPDAVIKSIRAIKSHDSASLQAQAETWEEERRISKYAADLPQLPAERISMDPSTWKCDFTGVTENLWLNLSTGKMGSGRPHFDGTGGNGAALEHYKNTGKKYPLVVKLGTITPTSADVYSYAEDEDDMVTDPWIKEHLAHWGIDMTQMSKTEKSMAELQHEKNMMLEFNAITEAGAELEPMSGQGFMGLKNLGNSCYMNSILQSLWNVPELKRWYVDNAFEIFRNNRNPNPAEDLRCQFTKVGIALVDKPCQCAKVQPNSVNPILFKSVAGNGHPEFSSGRQQDTEEYFRYIVEALSRAEMASELKISEGNASSIKDLFAFSVEDRIECQTSHEVQYINQEDIVLSLQIPIENKKEGSSVLADEGQRKRQKLREEELEGDEQDMEITLPKIALKNCIDDFMAPQQLENYNKGSIAVKTSRLASFPPYLMIHLRRYYIGENWTPLKMEALVEVPDRISIEHLRASGPQPGEKIKIEEKYDVEAKLDDAVISQLASMGFPESKCRKAALNAGNNIEAAMEWLLSHVDEVDTKDKGCVVNPESISELEKMGFAHERARKALASCDGDIARAIDWLFSHNEDEESSEKNNQTSLLDGAGQYELLGFVSHIGKNTSCGHYVCHLKKDGRWTIYNDEKVALSKSPPFEFGYMYLYKRCEA